MYSSSISVGLQNTKHFMKVLLTGPMACLLCVTGFVVNFKEKSEHTRPSDVYPHDDKCKCTVV